LVGLGLEHLDRRRDHLAVPFEKATRALQGRRCRRLEAGQDSVVDALQDDLDPGGTLHPRLSDSEVHGQAPRDLAALARAVDQIRHLVTELGTHNGTSGGLGRARCSSSREKWTLPNSSLRRFSTLSRLRSISSSASRRSRLASPSARRTRMLASSTASATMFDSETRRLDSIFAFSMISWAFSLVRAMNASRSLTIHLAARSSSGSSERSFSSITRNCSRSTRTLDESGMVLASWRWAMRSSTMSCSSPTDARGRGPWSSASWSTR